MIRWLAFLLLWPSLVAAQDLYLVEQHLQRIGFNPGPVDGRETLDTQRAVYAFQSNFGRLATGRLSASDAQLLARSAEFAGIETPFVITEDRPQSSTPDEIFGGWPEPKFPRRVYANGAHYLASRGSFNNLHANWENRKTYAHLSYSMEENNRRFDSHLSRARQLVRARGDALGAAILTLDVYGGRPGETWEETLPAFATVLAAARASPAETALSASLLIGINRRFARDEICTGDSREAVFSLLEQAVQHVSNSSLPPLYHSALLRKTLACAPDPQRDAYFERLKVIARGTSDQAVASITLEWARDADMRGDIARAQQLFFSAAELTLQGKGTARTGSTGPDIGAMEAADISAMHRLGMTAQALHMARHRVETILAKPTLRDGASRAEMGNYHWAITNTQLMLLDLADVPLLQQFNARSGTPPFPFGTPVTEKDARWNTLREGIKARIGKEEHARALDHIATFLPIVLRDDAPATALDLSLIEADAAITLGDFDVAEPAVVRVVSLARTIGVTAALADHIDRLQGALNLHQLSSLPPSQRILALASSHYDTLCPGGQYQDPKHAEFPEIDFGVMGDDPEVRETLLGARVLSRALSCGIARKMSYGEARFLCALSAYEGRADVVEYLLNGYEAPEGDYQRAGALQGCGHGLGDGGRFDWFRLTGLPQNNSLLRRNDLEYLAATPAARAAQHAAAADDLTDFRMNWHGINHAVMEKPRPRAAQVALIREGERTYGASFGNMGPAPGPQEDLRQQAIAFQRLGLFQSAEIYHYINRMGWDPLLNGTESAAELDDHLLKPDILRNRLDYARLYRAWGKPELARNAIAPLVERAIVRLGDAARPLPGTVEQVAKRLEPLFSEYLLLQFDGLRDGPNYPAIFAIQQYLALANSRASASVLEQRLNSASPAVTREYQDLRRQLRRALGRTDGDGTQIAALSLQLKAIEARLPKTDAGLRGHQIGVMRPLRETMKGLRDSGDTMMVLTQLRDRAVVMILSGETAQARVLDIGRRDAQRTVAAFRSGILDSSDTVDAFDARLAGGLYDLLIGWAQPASGKPPTRLRLVIDGPFATLPFAALRTPEGWLGAEATLRFAPNVARAAAPLRRPQSGRGFVGFGDPNLTKGDTAARAALMGTDLHLPELPETAAELTFLALAFGGHPGKDVFTREKATETQLRDLNASARLEQAGVLALATHGLLSTELSGLDTAALVLSLPEGPAQDGMLTATEIFGLRIGADLVILSACNTGTPGAGAGLSDLASAFLYAGAGALMLTHWEIDSGAGVELMKRVATGQRVTPEAGYPTHLREALAALLTNEGMARYHHPRFWASHFILG